MDISSILEIVPVFLIILLVHVQWSKYRINQWAASNGYSIIRCKLCLINIGPFSYFGTSGGQSIFRIQALDASGSIKKGYARAGGFFFGLLRSCVQVKLDKRLSI